MKTFSTLLVALLATVSLSAQAVPLSLANFSGTESIINFNAEAAGSISGPVTYQGVTFVAQSGGFSIQSSAGSLLGTTGAALNTNSGANTGDLTLNFATGISRFGANFGTCNSCATLSATVTAYDASNLVVESMSFPSFANTFVGFDFASSVSKIVIDRTDSTSFFTFIDDVRFKEGGQVPEPGSLALIGMGALAVAMARRRRKN
ncbi:MAG: PEP-CTERM sorting domain-containing protein [Massilia sp.]